MHNKIIRTALILLALCAFLGAAGAQSAPTKNDKFEMHPGETMSVPAAGKWKSMNDTIAAVDGENITALSEGTCVLEYENAGETLSYELTVDEKAPTELVKKAISIAREEFTTLGGKTLKKANKYTKWYTKNNNGFGWCGAFVGWCLDTAGVPMFRVEKAEPVDDALSYAISEASVGKILTGYTKMERTTNIPRPGYLVIYSVTKKSYYNIHVGMVSDVQDLGEGKYLLTTIEGNVSNRVKSYQYYYDSTDEAAEKQENMTALPKEMQVDEAICYKLHSKDWYIKTFCQTYK